MLLASFLSGDNKSQKFHIWTGEAGCHAPGTEIMMWGGGKKLVEDIQIGEQLMGDDGTPRTVQRLFHGTEMMCKVTSAKGDSYIVNECHKLALISSLRIEPRPMAGGGYKMQWLLREPYLNLPGATKAVQVKSKTFKTAEEADSFKTKVLIANPLVMHRGDIAKIPVLDFMALGKKVLLYLYGFKAAAEYPERELKVNPWFFGYWAGDGNKNNPGITTADPEVVVESNRVLADIDIQSVNRTCKFARWHKG